ncbi:MAG: class II aldolase/adducin family protein [Acidobacteria bacterium]|nr:class II aldolase/adducin family protein [Acidobacteriota bacterium]
MLHFPFAAPSWFRYAEAPGENLDRDRAATPVSLTPGTLKTEDEHRRDLCLVGRWIHQREYVAATDGNLSVRLDSQRVLATPTLMSKGMMEPGDLVVVDYQGKKVAGRRNASSEIAMHLLIYRRRPDVHAVVHAHPPVATGYAAAGLPLNQALISEVVLALGCIPLARYGTPGTPELSDALSPLVGQYDAILMANHGVVTYGADLLTAYMRMETVEHFARISLVTHLLGRQTLLSREEVEKLAEARARYFAGTGAPAAPLTEACPVAADGRSGPLPESARERFWVTREELEALIDEAVKSAKVR